MTLPDCDQEEQPIRVRLLLTDAILGATLCIFAWALFYRSMKHRQASTPANRMTMWRLQSIALVMTVFGCMHLTTTVLIQTEVLLLLDLTYNEWYCWIFYGFSGYFFGFVFYAFYVLFWFRKLESTFADSKHKLTKRSKIVFWGVYAPLVVSQFLFMCLISFDRDCVSEIKAVDMNNAIRHKCTGYDPIYRILYFSVCCSNRKSVQTASTAWSALRGGTWYATLHGAREISIVVISSSHDHVSYARFKLIFAFGVLTLSKNSSKDSNKFRSYRMCWISNRLEGFL